MLPPFDTYTDSEIKRWLWLRAVEWTKWPTFVSQPVVPVLLAMYPWLPVMVALLCVEFVWQVVQYAFVSVRLSDFSCLFVAWLKWPSAVGGSVYLFFHESHIVGVVALLWPLLAAFATAPVGLAFGFLRLRRKIGDIELALAKRIRYC